MYILNFCNEVILPICLVLGWCKINCGFALLNFAIWYWSAFLNKCVYIIHHFNENFLFYVSLIMTYYCVYFIEKMLDTENSSDFFFYSSSKRVIKDQRQLKTLTTHLAQEVLINIQCSGGSRSFAKETGALKIRSSVAGHQKLATVTWEKSLNLIFLQVQEELLKNWMLTILLSFGLWRKLERWKISISGFLRSKLQIKKS